MSNHDDLNEQVTIGQKFFQWRDFTPVPLILLALMVEKPTTFSVCLGTLLVVLGELIRLYSVAFIGPVSRTRSDSLGGKLITTGPYRWVRNPLYLGNFLIALGFCVFSAVAWVVVLGVALFAIQYHYVVSYEENNLASTFGATFNDYRDRTPGWIPRNIPPLSEWEWPDSFAGAFRSEKRTLTAIAAVFALMVLFS